MQTCIAEIIRLAYGGHGLCFPDGKAVFVPYSAPGDIAKIRIVTEKKSHAFGEIVELITPSPARIIPQCGNFGRCGGCEYLHLDYATELASKREILAESLVRIGKFSGAGIPIADIISGERFRYRSHATVKTGASGQAGFYARHSHELVPFPEQGCLLLAAPLGARLSSPLAAHMKDVRVALGADGSVTVEGEGREVREEISGITYVRDVRDFFQANLFLREKMLERAGRYAEEEGLRSFCDAGCGVGFFSLYLARRGFTGTAFDSGTRLIRMARRNAAINGIEGVDFSAAGFSSMREALHGRDVLICDPPRAGLEEAARKIVISERPRSIVYVSCDPSTFARDCGEFRAAGYFLSALTLIDMFPGTYHIEAIGFLKLG